MKGKLQSSRKKRLIAIIVLIIMLLAIAVSGVVIFLKDDGSATAVQNDGSQVSNNDDADSNKDKPNANKNQNDNANTEDNDTENNQNAEDSNNAGDVDDSEEEADNNNDNNTVTANGTTTNNQQINNGQPQEFFVYRDRLVAEDFLVGWTPMGIAALMSDANIKMNRPILNISKASYTEADLLRTGTFAVPDTVQYNAVRQGETVLYEITIKNISEIDAKSITVTDKVPEKTTLLNVYSDGIEENGKITWKLDIPALSEVKLRFKVQVNDAAVGNAENIAMVNGDNTNKVENPIITTLKVSEIYRKGQKVDTAKVGDTIRYTIYVENTGTIDGVTKVTDKVPVGSTLVTSGLNVAQDGTILWDNVLVPAGQKIALSFDVTINLDVTTSVKNIATVSITDTNETEDKVANIEGHKDVDKKVAWVGEKLLYTIRLTNNGSIPGTVTVTDSIPDGTSYVANSATANGVYNADKITWNNVNVVPGTPVVLTFKVKIDSKRTTSVFNTAIVDEDNIPEETETTETKVINIVGEKTSSHEPNLTEEGRIDYTIKLTNIGNASGKITVTDAIPAGTTYVQNSVDNKGSYDSTTNKITWTNVEVTPGTPVYLTFSVTVNIFSNGETKKNIINKASIGDEVIDEATKKLINLPVTKVWTGDADAKSLRTDIWVELLKEGQSTNNKIKISKTDKDTWTNEFKDLPKYDSTGKVINYSVREITTLKDGYESRVDGMTITNKYTDPTTSVTVTKVWNDNSNSTGDRPKSIKLILKANGTQVKTHTLTGTGNTWNYTFPNLPKYNSKTPSRTAIQYTVEEAEVKSGDLQYYTKSAPTGSMSKGFTITNTINYPVNTVNVEEISTTTKNKNVYIVLDASSSMNYTLDNGKKKIEVACDYIADMIDDVFALSSNSSVEVITFNTWREKSNKLHGTKVYGRATNATEGATLSKSIDAVTVIPKSDGFGLYNSWGTWMYGALDLVSGEIDKYHRTGVEDVVIFVGDGAPTRYNYSNGEISNPYDKNCNCDVFNMARTIRSKVPNFFVLGVDLATRTEDYEPEEAQAILKNLATDDNHYYNITNASGFETAFNKIFTGINTDKGTAKNTQHNPIITIQATGKVLFNKGVILESNQTPQTFTKKTFTNSSMMTGISYKSSTKTFTIDTRIFKGNLSLKYTIE